MSRKLTVYGGRHFVGNSQCRMIVATYTKRRAIEILQISASSFRDFWCATGNTRELEIAAREPEVVFYCMNEFTSDPVFKRLDELEEAS